MSSLLRTVGAVYLVVFLFPLCTLLLTPIGIAIGIGILLLLFLIADLTTPRDTRTFTEKWLAQRGPPREVRKYLLARGIDPSSVQWREPGAVYPDQAISRRRRIQRTPKSGK